MSEIFVSYDSRDRERIKPLVEALKAEDWSVWWDRDLIAGPSFDEKIEEALDAARCVVVAWSEYSVKSRWCRTEANEGLERQILVPLRIDEVRPPLAFRSSQTASLIGWPQEQGELDVLLAGIRQCLGVSTSASVGVDSDVKSIAVLPFVNISSDPEQEYFVDGITEDLIDRLSRHSSLRVIARTSSFYFKNRSDDVREIGRQLGVTHLVEGSVRRSGTKIRVTAQLVRTSDGGHEWSDQYDRELDDVFAVQDEITTEVTRQLTDRLVEPAAIYRPKPEAYDDYLKGQSWLRRRSYSGARQSLSFFDQAIETDPQYAEAYVAAVEASLMERANSVEGGPEPMERAADYVDKALALDSDLASALLQKAKILVVRDFDVQAALDVLRDVFDRERDRYEALDGACFIYAYAGRWDLVEQTAQKIIQIDPVGLAGYSWFYVACMSQGRLSESQDAMEALLALEPNHNATKASKLQQMARQGRIDEALSFIEDHGMQTYPQACFIYAVAGRREEIERVIAAMEARSGLKTWITHGYALLGDVKGVLRSLQKAIDNHDSGLWNLTGHGPHHDYVNIEGVKLESIYNRQEVQELLKQINFDRESISRLKV